MRRIAFPAISAGVHGFPWKQAAAIAMRVMRRHEAEYQRLIASAFDEGTAQLYRRTLEAEDL